MFTHTQDRNEFCTSITRKHLQNEAILGAADIWAPTSCKNIDAYMYSQFTIHADNSYNHFIKQI